MDVMTAYEQWLKDFAADADTVADLKAIADDPKEIERRLGNARGEIEQMDKYQYAVVNDNLELAYQQVASIIAAEKQRTVRYMPVIE